MANSRSHRHSPWYLKPAFWILAVIGVVFVGILTFVLLQGAGGGSVRSAEEHLAQGEKYLTAGQYDGAVIELKNALQQQSDNARARALLGRAHVALRNFSAAEKELEQAKRLQAPYHEYAVAMAQTQLALGNYQVVIDDYLPREPMSSADRAELHVARADAYSALKDRASAQKELEQTFTLDPDNAGAGLSSVRMLLSDGKVDEATANLDKLIAEHPDFYQAWSVRANLYERAGEKEKALDAYDRVLELNKLAFRERLNRSGLRIENKDYEGAEEDIDLLRKVMGDHPHVLLVEGMLNYHQKRYQEAAQIFNACLTRQSSNIRCRFYSAAAAQAQQDWEKSESDLSKFYKSVKSDRNANLMLANARIRLGKFKEAEEPLARILKADPNDSVAIEMQSYALFGQGNTTDGLSALRRITDLNPEAAHLRARLGMNLLMAGDNKAGIQELKQASELAPEQQPLNTLLVLAQLRAKKPKEAMRLARNLAKEQPDNSLGLVLQGIVHRYNESNKSAKKAFMQALELNPKDNVAVANLAEMAMKAGNQEEAIKWFRDGVAANPDNDAMLVRLVQLEVANGGDQGRIERQLQAAVQARPQVLPTRVLLAQMKLRQSDAQGAAQLLLDVPEGAASDPARLELLGKAQLQQKNPEAAVTTFADLVKVRNTPQAQYFLARAYAQKGDQKGLKRALAASLQLQPDFLPSQIVQTRLLINERKLPEAERQLKVLTKKLPEEPKVMELRGDYALLTNKNDEALKLFGRLARLQPKENRWVVKLAAADWAKQDYERAYRRYKAWMQKNERDTFIQFVLANAYLLRNDNARARPALEKLLAIDPDNAAGLNNLAWMIRKEEPVKAEGYARRAVSKEPNAAPFQDTLAMVLIERSKYDEALELLESASRAMPDNLDVQYHWALALHKSGTSRAAMRKLRSVLANDKPFASRKEAEALLTEIEN